MRRLAARGAAMAAVAALLSGTPSATIGTSDVHPVLSGLDGPRGLAVGPAGRLIYAEGDGLVSELIGLGHNAGSTKLIGFVPPTFIAPAVASDGGHFYVLTAGGPPGSGAATLYKLTRGKLHVLADIAAYQETDHDPYNLADPPEESNPFGVAPLPDGSVLVSDAAANDLLRVYPNGQIVTVARLKPRMVPVPSGLPPGFPPAGTMLPSEAVATSVTVGDDGFYYVGELRGFPATPGRSQIWRIAPDSVNAICDPAAPSTGACRRYADGFTSIVDLDAGPDGSLYVVELVKQSWLQWELGLVDPPVGGVFRIAPGGAKIELAPGELILPGGIAVDRHGTVHVSSPVFGPGMLARID
jgi:DNA-binding beta-propeller fold protein YncE